MRKMVSTRACARRARSSTTDNSLLPRRESFCGLCGTTAVYGTAVSVARVCRHPSQ